MEALDEDGALRPTIINVGKVWDKKYQASLLASPTSKVSPFLTCAHNPLTAPSITRSWRRRSKSWRSRRASTSWTR